MCVERCRGKRRRIHLSVRWVGVGVNKWRATRALGRGAGGPGRGWVEVGKRGIPLSRSRGVCRGRQRSRTKRQKTSLKPEVFRGTKCVCVYK